MTVYQLRVHGTPAPQGSKRHVGGGRMIEASKKVSPWRAAIVAEADRMGLTGLQLDGPLTARCTFYLSRPLGHRRKHGLRDDAPTYPAKVPDLDKLLRSTFDALTTAQVWRDDAQVVVVYATKRYADTFQPGALIVLEAAHA